jgi:hypothetical protein
MTILGLPGAHSSKRWTSRSPKPANLQGEDRLERPMVWVRSTWRAAPTAGMEAKLLVR